VIVVGPPGEAPPPQVDDLDALLREALGRLPVAKAAKEVAAATGLDRHDLYNRALGLKA